MTDGEELTKNIQEFSRITEERLKRLKEGIKESQQSRQTQTEQQLRQY